MKKGKEEGDQKKRRKKYAEKKVTIKGCHYHKKSFETN